MHDAWRISLWKSYHGDDILKSIKYHQFDSNDDVIGCSDISYLKSRWQESCCDIQCVNDHLITDISSWFQWSPQGAYCLFSLSDWGFTPCSEIFVLYKGCQHYGERKYAVETHDHQQVAGWPSNIWVEMKPAWTHGHHTGEIIQANNIPEK